MTDRRTLLQLLALSPLTLATASWAEAAAEEAGLIAPSVCLLTPATTAGPYYLDPRLVRAEISEGRPGAPLALALQVVDSDCRPVTGARVDVWHCDAAGDYSGFADQGSDRNRDTAGETFMRGSQFTDARGVAAFRSIWPGWYRGRTPHVHYKIFLDAQTLLTSQLFFPDGASDRVYAREPYHGRSARQDTTNATDGIARRAGPLAFARVVGSAEEWRADLVVGVAPAR
ncbi:MAG: intradiol ring-cleavage dioxygenase [Amaricoccus sp.]